MKLVLEGNTLSEIKSQMKAIINEGDVINVPPDLPQDNAEPATWASGGLVWKKVVVKTWPRIYQKDNNKGLPIFVNPPKNKRKELDPDNPNKDEVLVYSNMFKGDSNSGLTNRWYETSEHEAVNSSELE